MRLEMMLLPFRSSCLKIAIWIAPEVRPGDNLWTFFVLSHLHCSSPLRLCHQVPHTITFAVGRQQAKHTGKTQILAPSCSWDSLHAGTSHGEAFTTSCSWERLSQVSCPHETHKEEGEREESLVDTQVRRQIPCRFLLCKHKLFSPLERKGSHQAVLPHVPRVSQHPLPAWLKAAFY